MTTQRTNLYHSDSSPWTTLSFPAIERLLLGNDALPMRRLAALKIGTLNGNESIS